MDPQHTRSDLTLQDSLERVTELRPTCTENGWDGYDAEVVPEKVWEIVLDYLKKLDAAGAVMPYIYPTPRKSVQMEWEPDDETYIEIEFYEDHIGWFWKIKGEEKETEDTPWEEMLALVKTLRK